MLYRIIQFIRAFFALPPNDRERSVIKEYLSEEQSRYFFVMSRADQRHCLNVLKTALELKNSQPADDLPQSMERLLIRCCLLHDIGRGDFMGPFRKTYAVLLNRYAPLWARRHGEQDSANPLYKLLYRYYRHPEIGAAMLRELGDVQAASIIGLHHQGDDGSLSSSEQYILRLLQESDSKN